jgi:hypothetical protein
VAVGPLNCFAAYIGLLQPHSDDMSQVVDQLLKLIATFIGSSRLSRSGIICCINVFTSLLGLVIVSHLSPRGLGRFKGLDFDETYAPVARLESSRILLAYATYHGFKIYQMDVKSAFLNGPIKEEVYVEQPPSFEDNEYPNHVYKLSKALYGLKQAPRAWYECLRDFLITNGFKVRKADPTPFTKTVANDLFVCQIYVDDIIFRSTNKSTYEEFCRIMVQKFEMSMTGELSYFLGFQIKQLQEGTFISQTKYIQDILKKFGMKDAKPIKTPMGTNGHLNLDTGGKSVDQKVYRSMIGSLLYLCA